MKKLLFVPILARILAVDTKANTLLVSGPSFEVDRIRSLITQLQGSFNKGDSEIRMFKLKEADPVLLARTLTELFRNPSANGANTQAERRRNQQAQGQGVHGGHRHFWAHHA